MKVNYTKHIKHNIDQEKYKPIEVVANINRSGKMQIAFARVEYCDEITTIQITQSRIIKEEYGVITFGCKAHRDNQEIQFNILFDIENRIFYIDNKYVG